VKLPKIATSFQRLNRINLDAVEKRFSRKILRRDLSEIIVFLAVICYTIILSYYAIAKYNAFNAYAWDLGIFNQSLWTTLHTKNFLFSTVELFINPTGSFFGTHFSPILFLVLPFYALYSSPETLLVFQSAILALGAVPLYFFTKDALNNRVLAVAFSLSYLLYPALHGVNSFDFHVQAFLPLFFFCLMYYLGKEKWPHYFFFLFMSLFVAENVPVIMIFIGLYCFWLYRKDIVESIRRRTVSNKRLLIPVVTIVIALFWKFFASWIQTTFFPFNPEYLQIFKAVDNWSILGVTGDPLLLPIQVILHPGNAIAAFTFDIYPKMLYLCLLFAPLLFLSLDNSLTIITLVWLVPSLLSNYSPYYLIGTHFPAYIIPFIFLAAVGAVKKRVPRQFFSSLGSYARNILLAGLLFAFIASPLSPIIANSSGYAFSFSSYSLGMTEHDKLLNTIVDMVPRNASVLTQNNIFPHFSSRVNAYVYPIPIHLERAPPDAINKYINDTISKCDYVLVDTATDPSASTALIGKLNNLTYVTYAAADGIYLFKRNYQGDLTLNVP
jgi:uncharacterized membrane protein